MTKNIERLNEFTAKIDAMQEKTATQKARKAQAKIFLATATAGNDSALGRLEELLTAKANSKKTTSASQNRADDHFKMEIDGKIKYIPFERKTNGGRVEDLINGKNKAKFIVYSMDICNASTSNKRRVIEPVIMKTADFLFLLADCGALKNTNGTNPQIAIQASSKKLYNRLLDYPLTYDPEETYTEEDFEDLEV